VRLEVGCWKVLEMSAAWMRKRSIVVRCCESTAHDGGCDMVAWTTSRWRCMSVARMSCTMSRRRSSTTLHPMSRNSPCAFIREHVTEAWWRSIVLSQLCTNDTWLPVRS